MKRVVTPLQALAGLAALLASAAAFSCALLSAFDAPSWVAAAFAGGGLGLAGWVAAHVTSLPDGPAP